MSYIKFNQVIQNEAYNSSDDIYNISDDKYNISIEVKSIPYMHDNINSISQAAQFIVDNELYIIILMIRADDLYHFFIELNTSNATSYPYYYIGTDTWFDEGDIKYFDVTNFVERFICTFAGIQSVLTKEEYEQLIHTTI